jgi:hypothetical protein
MAQYEHLPIYKATYDFTLNVMHAVKQFPREYKHSLGERLRNECLDLVLLIYRANSSQNKKNHIEGILEKVPVVNMLLRLSMDLRILSYKRYGDLLLTLNSVGKQASGWIRANSSMSGGPATSARAK